MTYINNYILSEAFDCVADYIKSAQGVKIWLDYSQTQIKSEIITASGGGVPYVQCTISKRNIKDDIEVVHEIKPTYK